MNAKERLIVAAAYGLPWTERDEEKRAEDRTVLLVQGNLVLSLLVAFALVEHFGWTPERFVMLALFETVVLVGLASARWIYGGRRDRLG